MDAREALRLIAEDRTPCVKCGKPHEMRITDKNRATWADPTDGHNYHKMSARSFAEKVLAK